MSELEIFFQALRRVPMTSPDVAELNLGHRDLFASSIFGAAQRALQFDSAVLRGPLEDRESIVIVHARLANVVAWRRSVWFDTSENKHAVRQLLEDILITHGTFLIHFCNFLVCGAQLILQFVDLISGRRLFFLKCEGRVLNVDDAVIDRLLHFRKLHFVSCRNGSFREIEGIFEAGNCGRDGHDRHQILLMMVSRVKSRRDEHGAWCFQLIVSSEVA